MSNFKKIIRRYLNSLTADDKGCLVIALTMLAIVVLIVCIMARLERRKLKVLEQKGMPTSIIDPNFSLPIRGLFIIVIDNHEYLIITDSPGIGFTHKADCKYCNPTNKEN